MTMTIPNGGTVRGELTVPSSKSYMHRHVICSALSGGGNIAFSGLSDDILCTLEAISAIGYTYSLSEDGVRIFPCERKNHIYIGESGSTLRFMLPVICALHDGETEISLGERLAGRPLLPLTDALKINGAEIGQTDGGRTLKVRGGLRSGRYDIDGSVSSQFISGLLLALPLTGGDCEIAVKGNTVSGGYIGITLDVLSSHGIEVSQAEGGYHIHGKQSFAKTDAVCEGDFSTAAFFASAAALSGGKLKLNGLNRFSKQGDREIPDILGRMGADIEWSGGSVYISGNSLTGADIRCDDIPDLVPVLALVCAVSEGRSTLNGISRLKYKESDRVKSILEMISSLGGDAEPGEDRFVISGRKSLSGGYVNTYGDHRIAMTAAVSSLVCGSPVTIDDPGCVNKSCPGFYAMLRSITDRNTDR